MSIKITGLICVTLFALLGMQKRSIGQEVGVNYCYRVHVFSSSEDTELTWDGKCSNGLPNGVGQFLIASNNKSNVLRYVGEMHDGHYEGFGTLYYPDGSMLSAQFESGKITGQVLYRSKAGRTYSGDWNKAPDGFGTMHYGAAATYSGHWVMWQRSGIGLHVFSNGDRFIGEFARDKFNGQGTYTRHDGLTFSGLWVDGNLNGPATLLGPNGLSYNGDFSLGRRSGHGTLTIPNGSRYEGDWAEDQASEGVLTTPDGIEHRGFWIKDCLQENGRWLSIYGLESSCAAQTK